MINKAFVRVESGSPCCITGIFVDSNDPEISALAWPCRNRRSGARISPRRINVPSSSTTYFKTSVKKKQKNNIFIPRLNQNKTKQKKNAASWKKNMLKKFNFFQKYN